MLKRLIKNVVAGTLLEPAIRRAYLRVRFGTHDVLYALIPQRLRVWQMRRLWNNLSRRSRLGFISHLRSGEWDLAEFAIVGERWTDRICGRFTEHGKAPLSQSSVLEIGCGVGRILRPMASRVNQVVGVDISKEMLRAAEDYCAALPNVRLLRNDGAELSAIAAESIDYCYCVGVFQHITDLDVILGYLREAIRVLRPHGILLFQFEGNRVLKEGSGQLGARVTAYDLDRALGDLNFRIREVSSDPEDPIRNIVCVIEKAAGDKSFADFPMSSKPWLVGVYDGLTRTDHVIAERVKAGPQQLTFYYR